MNQAQVAPLLTSQLSGEAGSAAHEPAWLQAVRQSQRQALSAEGMPSARAENWKYTQLRALAQRRFEAGDDEAGQRLLDASSWATPGVDGPALVFVNGVFRADLSRLDGLAEGLQLEPLSAVLAAGRGEELRASWEHESIAAEEVFRRLNAASARDGVLLRVAAGASIEATVRLVFVTTAAAHDIGWHLRLMVDLGEQARLRVLEQHVAVSANQHLGTLTSVLKVASGAQLEWMSLQQSSTAASLFRHSQFQLAAGAQASLHDLELGGGLTRHDLRADLAGVEASFESHGVTVLRGRQHADTQLQVRHGARDTRSQAIWRGVADERSRVVFRGAIVVAEGADGSDAALSNKNLLLSPLAEVDSKPELEIYADEVKAAHGATVGQLDERALFYLRSRGIGLDQARRLLMAAFCQQVLDEVPDHHVREYVRELLLAQLPQAAD